jgi:CheY-like chemotaxis protein
MIKLTFLIADDLGTSRFLLDHLLHNKFPGSKVVEALSPEEVIKAIDKFKIDVAILDYDFGSCHDLTGIDLAVTIKQQSNPPIIVLNSAMVSFQDNLEEMLDEKIIDIHCPKPFTVESWKDLTNKIEELHT